MIVTRTPLRITFAGGGSDIPSYFEKNEGNCINAAIDKYVYVLVKKRNDNKIYLKYSENEVVDVKEIENIKHDFIRETLLYLNVDYGLEIINWADIPTKGSGLGSSGSFLVSLLNALHTLQGDDISKMRLAREASYIEMERCAKPIGYQDQYAATFGGINQFEFSKNKKANVDNINVIPINFSDSKLRLISDNILLFYTGITRESKTVLEDQNKNMIDNKKSIAAMKKNVKLSLSLGRSLREFNDYDVIGKILNENWILKTSFSDKIVDDEIRQMYEFGIRAGASGGKLLGAGGGGYMMFWVDKIYQNRVIERLSKYQLMPISIDKYGSRVLLNIEDKTW